MQFKYLDRPPQEGDVICWVNLRPGNFRTNHKPYYVERVLPNNYIHIYNDNGEYNNYYCNNGDLRVIATKPASEAVPGDYFISLTDVGKDTRMKGTVHRISTVKNVIRYKGLISNIASTALFHEIIVLCSAQPDNACYEAPLPELSSTQLKELPMTIQQILSTIFGNDKPTTDYDRRPAYLVIAYNRNGSEMGTATASSIDEVKSKVAATPELWGCKVLTYKLDQEVSVAVPVKATKAIIAEEAEELTTPTQEV